MSCQHANTVSVSGKCCDQAFARYHDGTEADGGLPSPNFGLGDGDYVQVTLCIDCGTVIGFDRDKYDEALVNAKEEEE
jgi:hypothetical protein